jgi:hypothetical protein
MEAMVTDPTEYSLRLIVPPMKKLEDACVKAQSIANDANMDVEFEFNGVDCIAVPGGDYELLAHRQSEIQNRRPRVTSAEGAMA